MNPLYIFRLIITRVMPFNAIGQAGKGYLSGLEEGIKKGGCPMDAPAFEQGSYP